MLVSIGQESSAKRGLCVGLFLQWCHLIALKCLTKVNLKNGLLVTENQSICWEKYTENHLSSPTGKATLSKASLLKLNSKRSQTCHITKTAGVVLSLSTLCLPFAKKSYSSGKIIECIFTNYNVELVLTQALLGSPFEPHPLQNSNWSNGTEIDELIISVLLLQFLFLYLYFNSGVLNSVLFLQFLFWYVNYSSNVFRKELDCQ